jgi:hypothetical protein
MKTIIATLFALAVGISIPAQAQTSFSTNALVIRQNSTGVLTVEKIPLTKFPNNTRCWSSGLQINDNTNPDNYFYTAFENTFSRYSVDQPFPAVGQMVIFFSSASPQSACLAVLPDDASVTGPFVAYTSSLSTVENIIKDKVYLGL